MNPAALQYIILAANFILLLFLGINLYQLKTEKDRVDKNKAVPGSKILGSAQQKSENIISRAISKAQDIVSVAQSKRLNLIAAEKLLSKKIVDSYRQDIEKLEAELHEKFEKNTESANKTYRDFLTTVEAKINSTLDQNQKLLTDKASVFIDSANKSLDDFTSQLENKIKSQIEGDMQKARQEIVEYRLHRQKVLDEKIVDILTEVLQKTIDKKLSLADQSDFIYKALEEAKNSHAF